MQKTLTSFFLLLIAVASHAQITFEKGYFIGNNGNKTTCLIRNIDWLNNPTEFEYKLSENARPNTATIGTVSEFGVANTVFKRFTVDIDRSSQQVGKLDTKRNPEFNEETLFLKVMITGDYNLYSYIDGNLSVFFYDGKNQHISQLVFKKYLTDRDKIGINNMYQQQLSNSLECNTIQPRDFENLDYTGDDLSDLFTKYNTCKGYDYTSEKTTANKGKMNLYLRAGVNINSFKIPSRGITNPSPNEFDFGQIIGFQIGTELEYVFGFNKNKWAVILEPTYNNFESESTSLNYNPETVTLKYSTLELPVGIRHYFFLNDKSRIFINGSYVFIFDMNSEFTTSRTGFDFTEGTNISFGLGYNFDGKYSIEGRLDTKRDNIFPDSNGFKTDFTSFSIILGINIL